MASVTLTQIADKYPVGTTVGAYLLSGWVGKRPPAGTFSGGAAVTTAAVSSAGSLAFTGLADDTEYFTYATSQSASPIYYRFNSAPVTEVVEREGLVDGTTTTIGFLGATPVAKPTAYTQTYSTAARTVPVATQVAVVTTAASTSAYGFTQAQADAIPVAINAAAADILALKKVVTALIDDFQAFGLLQ